MHEKNQIVKAWLLFVYLFLSNVKKKKINNQNSLKANYY